MRKDGLLIPKTAKKETKHGSLEGGGAAAAAAIHRTLRATCFAASASLKTDE